ncbi:hypothetical protein FRX94_06165 [Corynebacterium canis]|uniref:DUF1430 domain-containing protein n=1 Tax=Corynebacterium canis TaxID=679663 RepID=A0A5C5UI60_9CORY|nr:hypothetical protein [Corynebacterium canis]TWT25549.1 hypothetical protein FRX94_06165 [Corynebacterium canis]WJY74081.1 hypothetical protein CCANI_01095 [Corynebacterium canis]
MKSFLRPLSAAYAFLAIIAAISAFSLTKTLESDQYTAGNHAVLITDTSPKISGEQYWEALQKFSDTENIPIALSKPDLTTAFTNNTFYATNADIYAQGFNREITTEFRPLSEITTNDPRGQYTIVGDTEAKEKFLSFIRELGFEVIEREHLLIDYLFMDQTVHTVLISLVFLGLVSLAGVVFTAREQAIIRLHGLNASWSFVSMNRQSARFTLIVFAIVNIAGLIFLGFYNQFSGFSLFAPVYVTILGLGLAAICTGLMAGITSLRLLSLLSALKGQLPGKVLIAITSAVKVFTLYMLTFTLIFAVSLFKERSLQESEATLWQNYQNLTQILINAGVEDYAEHLAPSLRDSDLREEIVLADMLSIGDHLNFSPAILANRKFAELNGIQVDQQDDSIIIASPPNTSDSQLRSALELIDFERELAGEAAASTNISYQELPRGKEVFTFAITSMIFQPRATTSDSIIIILPPGLTALSDRNLAAKATQGSVLYVAPDKVPKINTVGGYSTAAERLALAQSNLNHELRQSLSNLSLLCVLLGVIIVAEVLVYRTRHARRLQVHQLLGVRWLRTHGLSFVADCVFALLPLYFLLRIHLELQRDLQSGSPAAFELARTQPITATIVALAVLASVAGLAISTLGKKFQRAYRE